MDWWSCLVIGVVFMIVILWKFLLYVFNLYIKVCNIIWFIDKNVRVDMNYINRMLDGIGILFLKIKISVVMMVNVFI